MEKIDLKAKIRDVFGKKVNKMRKSGLIPAVVYGKGIKSISLWVNAADFKKLLKKSGESTMINLEIDKKAGCNVIIYEIQRDPVSGSIIHADFFQVRMDEKIETEVELEFIGESPAVRDLGGVLVRNIDEIGVKCFPGDLPSHIDVDISVLKTFDDRICGKDLKISDKVEIDLDPETVVALVAPPRSEEDLGKLDEKVEEDVSKVEGVIKEDTPAEEGEGKAEDKKEKE
ncbi:MAG TPA: 50S ribosomal protein L25 [Candidatus Moranbacteria bacterium]|nr:50S ribosomal protein L25 [Candidatus Moranbacteria bacterium]